MGHFLGCFDLSERERSSWLTDNNGLVLQLALIWPPWMTIYKGEEQRQIGNRLRTIAEELKSKWTLRRSTTATTSARPPAEYEPQGRPHVWLSAPRDLENGTIELVRRDGCSKRKPFPRRDSPTGWRP